MTAETLLATLGLVVCLLLLGRMAIGERRRSRLDARLQQAARTLSLRARAMRRQRQVRGQAEREAGELIARARRPRATVERDGNVYRPRSFNGGGEDEAPDGRQRKDH